MSELDVNEQSPADVPAAPKPVTAGSLLRAAREASGLHIAALSVAMKVPVKKLEALESDRTDLLLDAVFARALASSVCRTLKIDPRPVLELLPQTLAPSLGSGQKAINAPFKASGAARHMSWAEFLRRPPVLAVMALLLAALVVVFMPDIEWTESTTRTDAVSPTVETTKEVPVEPVTPVKLEEKTPAVEVVPAPAAPDLVKSPVVEAAAAEAPVSAPVAKPADMVLIRAKGTTWVEVVDSTGAVLVRRTLQPDGVTSATGVAPLAVVVGKADAVDVLVRSKPFSLTGVSKDNVARFEVK